MLRSADLPILILLRCLIGPEYTGLARHKTE